MRIQHTPLHLTNCLRPVCNVPAGNNLAVQELLCVNDASRQFAHKSSQYVLSSGHLHRDGGLGWRRRNRADMKKSTLRIEQQQPRNIQRTDIEPETGYSMVVDGHFKTHFSQERAAKTAATELLARYPMLQVEIYDAVAKTRTRVRARNLEEVTQ